MNFDSTAYTYQAGSPITRPNPDYQEPPMRHDAACLLSGKPYIPAAQTDITKTFRRFGWTPPSERHAT